MRKPANVFTREDLVRDVDIRCDAVVIGSGAGGAVVAAELAEGGLDVVVLEEGGYHPTEEFVAEPSSMVRKLYRDFGAQMSLGAPPVSFAEGRCVGGSTVINGGMSWRTPEKILERWRVEHEMDGIDAVSMERHFARVERFISAKHQDAETIGRDNQLLKAGADAKNWKIVDNIRDQNHCAGANMCAFGCPTGAKGSTLVSYIPRALAFGARVYADCRVSKLVSHGKRVTGVTGYVVRADGSRGATVRVMANIVVVATGGIQTPALLTRSGIKSPSGQIGHNLSLHPNTKVVAVFDDKVEGWKGVHQAYQVREFQDEGFLMAAVTMPPSILAMSMHHYGPELGDLFKSYNNFVSAGILVEDTVAGRVRTLPNGQPMSFYQLSELDAERIVRGAALLCELLFAAGAKRILLPFHGVPDLHGPDDVRRLHANKVKREQMEIMTVHMMGTARMGGDRTRHVCDGHGKVYDADGLYIADASLFPTPIGVNPMETIMALATRNAERILESQSARRAA